MNLWNDPEGRLVISGGALAIICLILLLVFAWIGIYSSLSDVGNIYAEAIISTITLYFIVRIMFYAVETISDTDTYKNL